MISGNLCTYLRGPDGAHLQLGHPKQSTEAMCPLPTCNMLGINRWSYWRLRGALHALHWMVGPWWVWGGWNEDCQISDFGPTFRWFQIYFQFEWLYVILILVLFGSLPSWQHGPSRATYCIQFEPGFLWFLCSLDVPAILFSGVFWRIFFSGVWASPQGRNKSWLSSSEPMPVPAPRMSSVVIQVSSEFGIPQLPFGRETDDQRWGISDIQVDMSTIWINRGLKCCTPNFGTQGTCVMWQGRRSESHAPRARACLGDWVRGFLKDGRSVRSVKRAE